MKTVAAVSKALGHVLLLLAVLAACGRAVAGDALASYTVVIRDGRITPAQLVVPAGTKLRLELHNAGPGPCEFENLALRVEKVLAPGARSFIVLHPLKPGRYRFIDEFHPDTSEMILLAK